MPSGPPQGHTLDGGRSRADRAPCGLVRLVEYTGRSSLNESRRLPGVTPARICQGQYESLGGLETASGARNRGRIGRLVAVRSGQWTENLGPRDRQHLADERETYFSITPRNAFGDFAASAAALQLRFEQFCQSHPREDLRQIARRSAANGRIG